MIFEQYQLGDLSYASYLIGSEGVAAVVDPHREGHPYPGLARQHGLQITHIIVTRPDADMVAGSRQLARATGAAIYLGEASGAALPHRVVRDGDEIEFGKCRLRFFVTPGDPLAAISVAVVDPESGKEPALVLCDGKNLPPLAALSPADVMRRRQQGAMMLDTRPASEFYSGHIPGSIQIGLGSEFESCATSVLERDCRIVLAAEDDRAAQEARIRLTRAGLNGVTGKLADGIDGWIRAGLPLAEMREISIDELSDEMARNSRLGVVDVRERKEFEGGHVPGALLRPLDEIRTGLISLDPERLTAVQCKTGYRSAVACSFLAAHGFKRVMPVAGGFDAWQGAGLPAVRRAGAAWAAGAGIAR